MVTKSSRRLHTRTQICDHGQTLSHRSRPLNSGKSTVKISNPQSEILSLSHRSKIGKGLVTGHNKIFVGQHFDHTHRSTYLCDNPLKSLSTQV